jgi:hypothetical protein
MVSLARKGNGSGGNFENLDLTSIRFPSDALSIGMLRAKHPELFDKGFTVGGDKAQPTFFFEIHAENIVANMLYCERLIVVSAYAEAVGVKGLELGVKGSELGMQLECDVSDFKDELSKLYIRYGIASGTHHADQLIRDLEQQGVTLANHKHP